VGTGHERDSTTVKLEVDDKWDDIDTQELKDTKQ